MAASSAESVFTPAEVLENEERKARLIQLLKSGGAVLFVGAGTSIPVGYPSWPDLMKALEELATECDSTFTPDEAARLGSPLLYVDRVKEHILQTNKSLDRYQEFLYRCFQSKPRRFTGTHLALVKLPFKGILTSNYDPCLELALATVDAASAPTAMLVVATPTEASDFVHGLDWPGSPRRIAHLHGSYNHFDRIILGHKDYEKWYGPLTSTPAVSWTLHRKLLWALLATRHILFVGFSFDDPAFLYMLELVQEDLWRWNSVEQHFAIMGIEQGDADNTKRRAAHMRKKAGVETIFYETERGSVNPYAKFDHLVEEIARACSVATEASWLEGVNRKSLN